MTPHCWSNLATFVGAILGAAALLIACIAEWIDTRLLNEAKNDIETAHKKQILARVVNEPPKSKLMQLAYVAMAYGITSITKPKSAASIEDAAYDKQLKTHNRKYRSQRIKAGGRVCSALAILAVALGTYLRGDPYAGCSKVERVTQAGRIILYNCPAVTSR